MNNLQKTLLSTAAIFSFGLYAYFLRPQSDQVIAISANAATAQQVPDNSAAAKADFQAYADLLLRRKPPHSLKLSSRPRRKHRQQHRQRRSKAGSIATAPTRDQA